MRPLCLLLLCVLFVRLTSAAPLPPDTAARAIARLPATGLLLDKGWRYHPGDDPAWASPAFDERTAGWDTLNPTKPLRQLPSCLSTGISWLRLRLRPGDSLRRHALLLRSIQNLAGAYELYLNGRLVQRQGTLAPSPTEVQPVASRPEPVEVPGTAPATLVLAVRFAPWQPLLSLPFTRSPLLAVRLWSGEQLRHWEREQAAAAPVFLATGCVAGLLMLLHIAFFYYNPVRRANLYFAFYTGALGLGALAIYFSIVFSIAAPGLALSVGVATYVALILSSLWAVRALYSLFGFSTGRLFVGLCVACGLLLTFFAVSNNPSTGFLAFLVAILLATAEQLRLTSRALRRGRGGARIIGVGFGAALLAGLGLSVSTAAGIQLSVLSSDLTFPALFLPSALAISLFLAREFAFDAQLLQVKLAEVEHLSARTLAQEQERQALLAQQNETLEHQVTQRTQELQRSLTDLRTTQAQLIQKEKMASLGELTAGIAHEIQNPLNFVNNFSEVSAELCQEAQELLAATKLPAAEKDELTDLLADLGQNQTKITQHGRRAASIVRGMLEHSRTSAGERRPTDLNRLCDEYLRLAYQGLRATDKSFNAELTTDLVPNLPLVLAVGADVGRVLLNLLTNAFYAVRQRQQAGAPGYQPTVGIATRRVGEAVEIRVTDNGTGIPEPVRAKIFQPFFTTKPTGEGTGLGLSLSHDIIVQGHGGILTVESEEGQGTTFIIMLPLEAEV